MAKKAVRKKGRAKKSSLKRDYAVNKMHGTGATERVLAEDDGPEQKSESAKKEPQKTPEHVKLLILGVLAVILIIFAYKFLVTSEAKGLEQKCLDIQNDPALKYPCKCVPTQRADDLADAVDARSNAMCTCECDFGEAGKKVIEVRAAK